MLVIGRREVFVKDGTLLNSSRDRVACIRGFLWVRKFHIQYCSANVRGQVKHQCADYTLAFFNYLLYIQGV